MAYNASWSPSFFFTVSSYISRRLSQTAFADAVVKRPDKEEQTRDRKKNEASRRRRNRPFSTTMTAWEPTKNAKYGVGKRTGDREPVFRDEKDDPFTRTSPITSVSFLQRSTTTKREAIKNSRSGSAKPCKYWNSAAVGFVFPKGGLMHSIFSFFLFVRMISRLEFVEEGRSSKV